ncbi:MAG: hypothetical protein O3B84_07860, partial [Chloroflexi bacterium]|nr:hypothetical protein [Chloroflexota bacterium]
MVSRYGRSNRDRYASIGGGFAVVVVAIAAWQILAWVLDSRVLPAPLPVARAFWKGMGTGMLEHVAVSGYRVALGVALAAVTAAPVGLLLGAS